MGKRDESELQINCVKWFRYQYPKLKKALFSVPNGGIRKEGEAKRMKAEGLTPGASDLILAIPNRENHGVFIEMKTPIGRARKEQKEFLSLMQSLGYRVEICRSFEQFMSIVINQLKNR